MRVALDARVSTVRQATVKRPVSPDRDPRHNRGRASPGKAVGGMSCPPKLTAHHPQPTNCPENRSKSCRFPVEPSDYCVERS
jgi:hypothetical protein